LEGGDKIVFKHNISPTIGWPNKNVRWVLNQYLQNYMNNDPRNWGEHLSLVEFYYNSTTHSMTKMSLFELPLGKEIRKPVNLAIPMG
jgi:hypothetical protein